MYLSRFIGLLLYFTVAITFKVLSWNIVTLSIFPIKLYSARYYVVIAVKLGCYLIERVRKVNIQVVDDQIDQK